MELSPTGIVLLGLLLAGWTFGAAALILATRERVRQARNSRAATRRLARMIEHSPAIPLLVKTDGAIEGPERLAAWLGLDRLPNFLSELRGQDGGLSDDDLERLREAVRHTQKTAAPFRMEVMPRGSRRSLVLQGHFADQVIAPGGAALVWWFDFSESQEELLALRAEAEQARRDFAALVGLIEAAPVPLWFRGPDLQLRFVNQAYVAAIGAGNAQSVIDEQSELLEAVDGHAAAHFAALARDRGRRVDRTVLVTTRGQRRAMRVADVPLGEEGVAGSALDIQEVEEQGRALRAFHEAQRAMLDLLSVGVAQFDYERRLVFANQPFHRLFSLPEEIRAEGIEFQRFLDSARDKGRLPEMRDFPAWRQELAGWFGADGAVEEAWTLPDGTHLRVVGLPMPDGGLVLLAEDRSEQLALSATRDTLLRTRAAMLDSVSEALAVFAPDGRLQLWNRRFADLWALPGDYLDGHPRAEELLGRMARQLDRTDRKDAIGQIVRAATLDREQRIDRVTLADGLVLEIVGVPLPDGNGLLTQREPTASTGQPPAGSQALEPDDRPALDRKQIELLPFITALVREREAALEEKKLTLNLRGDRSAGQVMADEEQLARAVGIVVDDAIAASPQEGTILVSLARRRQGARIGISDQGRAERTVQAPEIAQARQIIEAHGGSLKLQSEPDAGTTATITLA